MYFRVTAYHQAENVSAILDSNGGLFEKLWQFSAYLIPKGFKIIEASNDEKFLDVNISKAPPEPGKVILRAQAAGKPENVTHILNGIAYHAVKVGGKVYIPDKDKIAGG